MFSGFSWKYDYILIHFPKGIVILSGSTRVVDFPATLNIYTL